MAVVCFITTLKGKNSVASGDGVSCQALACRCLQTRTFCVQMGAPLPAQPPGVCMPASWFPWLSKGRSKSFTKIFPATKRHLIFHLQRYICFLFFFFNFISFRVGKSLKRKGIRTIKIVWRWSHQRGSFPRGRLSFIVCVCAKLLQTCLILCEPMDCSPPGSSIHGILQARILGCLEWVAVPSPRVSS